MLTAALQPSLQIFSKSSLEVGKVTATRVALVHLLVQNSQNILKALSLHGLLIGEVEFELEVVRLGPCTTNLLCLDRHHLKDVNAV